MVRHFTAGYFIFTHLRHIKINPAREMSRHITLRPSVVSGLFYIKYLTIILYLFVQKIIRKTVIVLFSEFF